MSTDMRWKVTCPEQDTMIAVPPGSVLIAGRSYPFSAFCIDRYEVSTERYQRCVGSSGCNATSAAVTANRQCNVSAGRTQHPMNCVNVADAQLFCRQQFGRLPRLPEWLFAALGPNGTGSPSPNPAASAASLSEWGVCWGRTSLLGGDKDTDARGTCPINRMGRELLFGQAEPKGLVDLVGNLGEWVLPEDGDPTEAFSVGGSWGSDATSIGALDIWPGPSNTAAFPRLEATLRWEFSGFRCVYPPTEATR